MSVDLSLVKRLSLSQKLVLVEELWDDIASQPSVFPVTDWLAEEHAQRKAEYLRHPDSAISWGDAKAGLSSDRAKE